MADEAKTQANGYYLNIEGYYDQLHRTTWARRTAGWLAGATIGAAYGAAGGLVAAFIPYALGALGVAGAASAVAVGFPTLAAIGSSVALFASVLAGMGMFVTADVATGAASSAAGLEEKERREKLEMGEAPPTQNVSQTVPHEVPAEQKTNGHVKGPPMFSWKIAAVTVPLFAAFGALVGLSPLTSVLEKFDLFKDLTGPAAIIASAATIGTFGACLGLKTSLLTNKLSNFYYKLVTDQFFNKSPDPKMAVEQSVAIERAAEKGVELVPASVREQDEPVRGDETAVAEKVKFLQTLLEKSRDTSAQIGQTR